MAKDTQVTTTYALFYGYERCHPRDSDNSGQVRGFDSLVSLEDIKARILSNHSHNQGKYHIERTVTTTTTEVVISDVPFRVVEAVRTIVIDG